jgi:O-antigen biosynthesis protein
MYNAPYANPFTANIPGRPGPIVLPPIQAPQPPELSLPRFINYMADMGGCGHYRILWPEQVMNARGMAVSHNNTGVVGDPNWYHGAKVVQIQRQAADDHVRFAEFLSQIKEKQGFRLLYNIDDVPFKEHIPDYNKFKFAFDNDQVRENIINIISYCDEVIVTCDAMKNIFKDVTGKEEITVIPNFPPHFWMGHLFKKQERYKIYQTYKKKPRILYTGSGAHFDVDNKIDGKDDFEEMIKYIVDTRQQYQWVFVGAVPPPLAQYVKSGQIEVHDWVQLLDFPRKVASLQATLTIAP